MLSYFIMLIATFVAVFVLGYRYYKSHKGIIKNIRCRLQAINSIYKSIFTERSKAFKFIQIGTFLGAELFMSAAIIIGLTKTILVEITIKKLIIAVLGIIIVIVGLHLIIGHILLTINHAEKVIVSLKDKHLKTDWLLSYFILSIYTAIFMITKEKFTQNSLMGLIGLGISYYLNIKILIRIIVNPNLLEERQTSTYPKGNILAALMIVCMILLNLFLGVVLISSATPMAFTNNPTTLDLFYYTCITFLTIGYGDIVPVSVGAKLISILIGVTSVVCISIFLSTILGQRKLDK